MTYIRIYLYYICTYLDRNISLTKILCMFLQTPIHFVQKNHSAPISFGSEDPLITVFVEDIP